MPELSVDFSAIAAAHERLRGIAHCTPALRSKTADREAGAQLHFKCESLQRVGAFKFRGAYNALAQFSDIQKARGVVTYSSGNHAQAIALAAKLLSIPAVVVMPNDAPAIKLAATRGYGAEVVLYDRYTEDREALGSRLAIERELTLVPPFDHPQVIAGQGTVAKELFEQVGALDCLVVPLGGGGLLSGCALAARGLHPNCKVIGVEPQAGNDGQQSFRNGRIVRIATPDTVADGAQTQALGAHTFPIIHSLVDDIVTVADSELTKTMAFLATRMKLLVEPTGCLAAAAVLEKKIAADGQRVGVVLSGGNVDLQRFAALTSGL
jgi:threo-3-hydroxy-L-aspartate ammonia-lyase